MYRSNLPQLQGMPFLVAGGLDTAVVGESSYEPAIPDVFHLFSEDRVRAGIEAYFHRHARVAQVAGAGLVLESATWQMSPDRVGELGLTDADLESANRTAIDVLLRLRQAFEPSVTTVVVSGCIGPRRTKNGAEDIMIPSEAAAYHTAQIDVLTKAGADMITAVDMSSSDEAIGVTTAAQVARVPLAVSLRSDSNGRLASGETVGDAIGRIDRTTGEGPVYFMVSCPEPEDFRSVLQEPWAARVRGLRTWAGGPDGSPSRETAPLLRERTEPQELGALYRALRARFPHINVLGGWCVADEARLDAIASARMAAA